MENRSEQDRVHTAKECAETMNAEQAVRAGRHCARASVALQFWAPPIVINHPRKSVTSKGISVKVAVVAVVSKAQRK